MIIFRDVYSTPGASHVLWDLLLERADEDDFNISFSMPTREQHESFIANSPYAGWYLIEDDGIWIGHAYVGWGNEIGLWLFREHRGQGYGRKTLDALLSKHSPLCGVPGQRPGHFVANINPLNEKSIRLFESLGFRHIQNTYRYEP